MLKLLAKIFGDKSQKDIKLMMPLVEEAYDRSVHIISTLLQCHHIHILIRDLILLFL